MIAYADACEKAKAMFTEAGYKTWQTLVMELPDKWIFFGLRYGDGRPDFGSCTIAVEKDTGAADWYSCYAPNRLSEYLEAKPVSVPDVDI